MQKLSVPCYVFWQLGRVRRIEFHVESEIIVAALRRKKIWEEEEHKWQTQKCRSE